MAKKNKIFKEVTDASGAYSSALKILIDILNNEISIPKAEVTAKHLREANRTFALQLKYSEMTKDPEKTMSNFFIKKDEL